MEINHVIEFRDVNPWGSTSWEYFDGFGSDKLGAENFLKQLMEAPQTFWNSTRREYQLVVITREVVSFNPSCY